MKIKQVQLNNFRAYKNEIFNIPEDKNIILIYGRNGFGKTSFFDSIEWGLTGKLQRYHDSALERNDYPMLRNSFAKVLNSDGVQIVLSNADHREKIKRFIPKDENNDYGNGILSLNGETTTSLKEFLTYENYLNDINFEESFNFTQLLSQELISGFIRSTKDPDRYRIIENLFGLKSFHKFDKYFKISIGVLETEFEEIDQLIKKYNNEIQIETSKLNALTIEPHVKFAELEKIYGDKIEKDKLEGIKSEYINKKIKLQKQKDEIEIDIKKLEYLQSNFKLMENKINEYNKKYSTYDKLVKFVDIFKKKKYFNIIDQHFSNYQYFLEHEDTINSDKQEFETLINIRNNPLFNEYEREERYIKALGEFKKEDYSIRVNKYFKNTEMILKLESTIKELDEDLKKLSSLKKELYLSAVKFLEDNNNQALNVCPVCENDFNQFETLDHLKAKLEQTDDTEFKAIHKVILEKKEELSNLIKKNTKEKKEFLQVILKINQDYQNKFHELKNKVEQNKIYINSNQSVIDSLAALDISIEEYRVSKSKYIDKLEKMSEYREDASIDYYLELLETQNASLNSEYTEFQLYLSYKKEFNIKTFDEITNILSTMQEQLKEYKLNFNLCEKASLLSQELIVYFVNDEIKKKINSLKENIEKHKKKMKQILGLKDDYNNLKDAVKNSSDQEAYLLLEKYAETIKKFYHYLNPSIYMRDLNLKIHKNKKRGNRLIFEVISENKKKHSPSYIFSAAQNNVLALSIFLSFAIKQQWSKLDSIFLDDPIQNMDDINIHSFVDLIRGIQKQTNKQFFISTHDDRIYNFMLHKFGKDNVHTFEFEDYGVLKK